MKYENEGRFGLGCAKVVQRKNNCEHVPSGIVIKPFDYSGKTLITIKDYKTKQDLEFRRIKTLSTKTKNMGGRESRQRYVLPE